MAEEEHEHGHAGGHASPLSGLSAKQKTIGGAILLVAGLGLWAAHKNNTAAPEAVTPTFVLPDTMYVQPDYSGNGSTIPPTSEDPVTPPVGIPTPTPPILPTTPPASGNTGYDGSGFNPNAPKGADLGKGGIDYNASTTTWEQKKAIELNESKIKTDPAYVLAEEARTKKVIANRTDAGLAITDQLKYEDKLEAAAATQILASSGAVVKIEQPKVVAGSSPTVVPVTPKVTTTTTGSYTTASGQATTVKAAVTAATHEVTVVSTSSSVANAGLGNGGVNYNTGSAADKAAVTSNAAKLASDAAFVASEKARTAQVIANRTAAGLDVSDQLKYQATLNNK